MAENTGTTVLSASVTVGGTAVLLAAARLGRRSVTVQNTHATQHLWIGGTGVTVAAGTRVAAAFGTHTFDDFSGDLYGIADGAGTDVRVLQVFQVLMFLVAALHMGAGEDAGGGAVPVPLPVRVLVGAVVEGTHSVNPKSGPNPGV